MKKHVPFLLSLLSVMGLLAWTASVRAQCLTEKVTLDVPITVTATDLSDHAHTLGVNGATYVNGQDGGTNGALNFAGQAHGVTIPADPAFEPMGDAFTISAWVYPVAFQQYNAVVAKLNASHRNILLRYHNDGKIQVHFTNVNNGITAVTTDSAVIELSAWQHIAATWDGEEMRIYVDGQLKKDMVLTMSPTFQSAGSVRLGTLNYGSERMVGYLDNVQMRAYATPVDEIACLMDVFTGSEHSQVLNLPLDNSGVDVSSNGNDANFFTVGVGTDRWNENAMAVNFGGSGYAVVPNIAQYNDLTAAFTISAWIKPTAVSGTRAVISKAGSGRDIVLRIDNGKLTAHYYVTGYTWCSPPTATVLAGEWSHIACTWDGTTMAIYHNGEMLHSIQPTMLPSFGSNAWSLGSLTASGGEYFTGQMDDVKVWDRALNLCELRSDIHANENLIQENELILCSGQTTTLMAPSGMCSYNWVNDGSSGESFLVEADNFTIGDHQIVLEAYDYYDHLYTDTLELTVSLCTGIQQEDPVSKMHVYPNPANNVITVSSNDVTEIQLMDLTGRTIQSTRTSGRIETRVEVSNLPAGVYILSGIRNDGTVVSKRLVKQ